MPKKFLAGARNMCDIDIGKEGDTWVAVIHHTKPPLKDKRADIPDKELRNHDREDLLTELKKYLEDCYDDD